MVVITFSDLHLGQDYRLITISQHIKHVGANQYGDTTMESGFLPGK